MGSKVTPVVVESPGMLTTVQDAGREGCGPMGVSPAGAADWLALQLANLLVANRPGAAGLEMTLTGGRFLFPEGALVALAGSNFSARTEERALEMWTSHTIPPGGTVAFGGTQSGARCYLAVAGGIDVPQFLGSASTHMLSGLGGFAGRALRKGDVLQLGEPAKSAARRKLAGPILDAWLPRKTVRITKGPQHDWFLADTWNTFRNGEYLVTEESDRLGMRLDGPLLAPASSKNMITEGVTLGAVQVTPSGRPIILFVDQQTTGGYPKIANVIGADRSSLAQLKPRDLIRFEEVALEQARALWIEQQKLLANEAALWL